MTRECERLRERIALGEDARDDEHMQGCEACRAAFDALALVRAALAARAPELVEPSTGFEARVTARALERGGRRRRTAGAVLGALVAAVAVIVVVVLWTGRERPERAAGNGRPTPPPAERPAPPAEDDTQVMTHLLLFSDVEASLRVGASWRRIEEPVAGMKVLTPGLKGEGDEP